MSHSHKVAKGGIFAGQRVCISKETQDLLKIMMKESHLTNLQQRQLNKRIERGEPLPVECSNNVRKTKHVPKGNTTMIGSRGIRTHNTILQLQSISQEDGPSVKVSYYNSSVEKERLQKVMSNEPETVTVATNNEEEEEEDTDRFDEVLQEITERQQFLRDMEKLGRRKDYESKILSEISQKIRELELIDKERLSQITL